MKITLSRLHFPVTTLGYGKRIGLWFQGCSIGCKNCVSTDTWANDKTKKIELEALYPLLQQWLPHADGITLSGGEPFEQFDALHALLLFLQTEKQRLLSSHQSSDQLARQFSVFVYSGYPIEALQTQLAILQQQTLVDAIMTDPFDSQLAQTKPLRGSDNQRLFLLTALGQQHFAHYQQPNATANKALDMMYEAGKVWLAGVPLQQDLPKLVEKLHAKGHHAITSQKRKKKK